MEDVCTGGEEGGLQIDRIELKAWHRPRCCSTPVPLTNIVTFIASTRASPFLTQQ
jgi:hypothetical protein